MDKAELLKNRLQASIDFAEKMNEDLDSASWNYQEGVLLSCNEAKLVIELINKSPIHNVVKSLPSKDEIYSSAAEYARNVQNPNRNIILTLRRTFKDGANFIKNKLLIE